MPFPHRLRAVILILVAACPWAGRAAAAPATLRLDPQASRVRFDLDALAHTIHGSLRVVRGEVRFDVDTGEAAGEIVVDARSAETGNGSRDRTMHAEVLESHQLVRLGAEGDAMDAVLATEDVRDRGLTDPPPDTDPGRLILALGEGRADLTETLDPGEGHFGTLRHMDQPAIGHRQGQELPRARTWARSPRTSPCTSGHS